MTLTIEQRIRKLSAPQRELLLTYGDRLEYGGNRRMADALVTQGLAEWIDTARFAWKVRWTEIGLQVIQELQRQRREGT